MERRDSGSGRMHATELAAIAQARKARVAKPKAPKPIEDTIAEILTRVPPASLRTILDYQLWIGAQRRQLRGAFEALLAERNSWRRKFRALAAKRKSEDVTQEAGPDVDP